jgi:acyl-ACP thioesterase
MRSRINIIQSRVVDIDIAGIEKHMPEQDRKARTAYRYFLDIPTRWMDNDVYAHVNNVVYYSYLTPS